MNILQFNKLKAEYRILQSNHVLKKESLHFLSANNLFKILDFLNLFIYLIYHKIARFISEGGCLATNSSYSTCRIIAVQNAGGGQRRNTRARSLSRT